MSKPPNTLHLVPTSPAVMRLDELRALLADGDVIMFIEDGVYFARQSEILSEFSKQQIVFLTEDAAARGVQLSPLHASTDYAGFVDLTAECGRSVSWY